MKHHDGWLIDGLMVVFIVHHYFVLACGRRRMIPYYFLDIPSISLVLKLYVRTPGDGLGTVGTGLTGP